VKKKLYEWIFTYQYERKGEAIRVGDIMLVFEKNEMPSIQELRKLKDYLANELKADNVVITNFIRLGKLKVEKND
jgi:hypothetical protein